MTDEPLGFNQKIPQDFHSHNQTWMPPRVSVMHTHTDDELKHLQSGGTLYSYGKTWRDSPSSESTVRLGPFMDENEGEERFALALHNMGYREPKWWQYWRWNEWKLSETVRDRIAALEAKEK